MDSKAYHSVNSLLFAVRCFISLQYGAIHRRSRCVNAGLTHYRNLVTIAIDCDNALHHTSNNTQSNMKGP